MSSKPVARRPSRRIVPAIPYKLAGRGKVVLEGKSDQQLQDDNGKSASRPIADDQAQAASNKVENDAHNADDAAPVSNEAKQAPVEKKETNGVAPQNQPHQDVQARPFVPKHQAHRSDTLVFGGLQDSPSSASPANASAMFMPPPPPVPVMPHQMTHYDNYYPAPHYGPPVSAPMPWSAPPPPINGHAFPHTNGTAAHLNGMSPSPSQTSSMAPGDSGVITPDAHAPLKHHAPHPSFHVPAIDANIKHLLDFLLAQFGKSEFADYVLELSTGGQGSKPVMLPVHSLMLARCPSLLNIIHQLPSTRTYGGALIIHFPQSYYFQDANAFADALRFVYGAPLVDPAPLLHAASPAAPSLIIRMRYVLSYLASGHYLDVPNIATHAANIASHLLTWDTLEILLSFAVSGAPIDDGHTPYFYGFYAEQLLHQALDFVVLSLSPDFVLNTSVTQLSSLPRLPQSHVSIPDVQSRPGSHSSLFATSDAPPTQRPMSGIRFGQATPADSDATLPAQILSAVLLSLPFNLLKGIFEHRSLVERLGSETLQLIAGDVVRERERRRVEAYDALQDKSAADEVLFWRESVAHDMTGTRLNLVRTRVS